MLSEKIPGSELFVFGEKNKWEVTGEGVKRKILGYNSNLMMLVVDFKKGSIGAVHKHPHTQTSYILTGSFEVQIASEKKILKKGDCYFIPPDTEHGVTALEDSSLVDVFSPCRTDFLK